jgi:hypothetical protein
MRPSLPARASERARPAARQGELAHSPLSFLDSSKTEILPYHRVKRFRNGRTGAAWSSICGCADGGAFSAREFLLYKRA